TIRSLSASGMLPMTTALDLPSAMLRGHAEPELPQRPLVLSPLAPHLHREGQVDLDPEKRFEVTARGRPDPLEHAPGLADENALLGVALHEDRGPDVQRLRGRSLRQLLHLDGGRVGDLLVREQEDLLA